MSVHIGIYMTSESIMRIGFTMNLEPKAARRRVCLILGQMRCGIVSEDLGAARRTPVHLCSKESQKHIQFHLLLGMTLEETLVELNRRLCGTLHVHHADAMGNIIRHSVSPRNAMYAMSSL